MALSDPRYLIFLAAIAYCLVVSAPSKRAVLLLAFNFAFLLLLGPHWYIPLIVAACGYVGALALQRMQDAPARDASFVGLLFALFAPLLFYKYLPVVGGLSGIGISSRLILPIGISFYTFATVGYLIDVYVEKIEAERNILTYANFVLFFPNFSVGPIERAGHLIPQLSNIGVFDAKRAVSALQFILIGYVYKVVVADSLAPIVDSVYADYGSHSSADVFLATFYFAFQVYADFAGYSLIAIGSARLLGIELLPNFRQPYFSETVADFWRRWHISLSNWFRDYAFTPLHFRLRKSGKWGIGVALIASFVLVGLWHGGALQFVVFGLIHGTLVVVSTFTLRYRNEIWTKARVPVVAVKVIRIAITFTVVCATLVLFRAASMPDAIAIYGKIVSFDGPRTISLAGPGALIAALMVCDWLAYQNVSIYRIGARLRWSLYYAAIALVCSASIIHLSQGSSYAQQFIYFKF